VDPETLLSPECAGRNDFKSQMIAKSCAPLAMIALCICIQLTSKALGLIKNTLTMDPDRHLNTIMTFFFSFFTAIATLCFQLFSCNANPNGSFTMDIDAEIICYDSDAWKNMLGLAIACVIVYIVGLMSYFSYGVFLATRGRFSDKNFQKRWKFLFSKYHPDVCWFGLVCLSKGVLLNGSFSIFTSDYFQLYFAMVVTIIYCSAVIAYRPYRHTRSNMLEVVAQLCLLFTISSLNRFADGTNGMDFVDTITMLVSAVIVPLGCFICFGRSYMLKKYALDDKTLDLLRKEFSSLSQRSTEEVKQLLQSIPDGDRVTLMSATQMLHVELGLMKSKRLSTFPLGTQPKSNGDAVDIKDADPPTLEEVNV